MSKRSADIREIDNPDLPFKKGKHCKTLDFSKLDKEKVRQIKEAVCAAMVKDSLKPILIEQIAEEDAHNNTFAYWPASEEVGEWLLQALLYLESEDLEEHVRMASTLAETEHIYYKEYFKGYYNNLIQSSVDLGTFKPVRTGLREGEDDASYIERTSLSTWLYSHFTFIYC